MGDLKEFSESRKVFKGGGRKRGRRGKKEDGELISSILGSILGIFMTLAPLFFTVYVKSEVTRQGYLISRLVSKIRDLEDRKEVLSAKLLSLENSNYLYSIARKMGFEKPTPEKVKWE